MKAQLDYELSNIGVFLYSNDYYNELNRDYQNKGGAYWPLGYLQTFDDKDKLQPIVFC